MAMHAYGGDAAQKTALINRVRGPWEAREVLPTPILTFKTPPRYNTLIGTLSQTEERQVFEERTGIPYELAAVSEGLASTGLDIAQDESNPIGFTIGGPEQLRSFSLEWLEAIRPGANLGEVIARYTHRLLSNVLSPGSVLNKEIDPNVRQAGERIAALWRRELNGECIDAKEWRDLRRDAVTASDANSSPWGASIAHLVESAAWPVLGFAREAPATIGHVTSTILEYARLPFFEEEDRANQTLRMKAFHAMDKAKDEPGFDSSTFLDTMPEAKRAFEAAGKPEVKARVAAAKSRARAATDPIIRGEMNALLDLIRAA